MVCRLPRGNSTKHIHYRRIMDVFHRCMRIFCGQNAYILMVHLTTHMKCLASQQARLPLAAAGNPRTSENEDCNSGDSAPPTPAAGILSHEHICAECAKYLTEASEFPVRAIYSLLGAPDKRFSSTLDSLCRCPRLDCSFHSVQAATQLEFHVPYKNSFARRWFCVVHGPKPPFHCHN